MSDQLKHTGELIAAYLATYWGCPCHVTHIEQIPGGASRQTYLVKLNKDGLDYGVIVRRDPPSSLIDTERSHEYNTYAAIYRDGVMPVPEPIVLEQDHPGEMGYPFSVMSLITDGQAAPAGLDEPHMQPWLTQIGQKKWTMLGELARKTPVELGVEGFMNTPDHPAAHELAYWKGVIDADALHPQPIAAATIRWLESNLPNPPSQFTLVHGDYRTGNFLYTETGEITAVLDWEMAHIGDPLEDLAWSLEPLWSTDLTLAGRLLPRQQAIDIWQRASGIEVNREDFRWWQIFASLKGLAIWISSAEDYANGTTKEPILAFAGWPMIDRQNRILLDRLSPESDFVYAEALA